MNTLEILIAARDRLAKPRGWCQFTLAMNQYGAHVDLSSRNAVSFSLTGALYLAMGNSVPKESVLSLVRAEIGGGFICDWNDRKGRTQREVVQLLGRLIERQQLKRKAG